MKTDIEIAQEAQLKPIRQIAAGIGISDEYLEQYGSYKAKIKLSFLKNCTNPQGKLILVTAITPQLPVKERPPP